MCINEFSINQKISGQITNKMFAMARLVVSQQLQVLAADKGLIHVLGCNPDDANGQSVLSFIGPRSNMRLLQSQIHCMTGEKVQLILYDHAGCERRTIVSCSTYHRESCFVGCLLKLHLSEQSRFKMPSPKALGPVLSSPPTPPMRRTSSIWPTTPFQTAFP